MTLVASRRLSKSAARRRLRYSAMTLSLPGDGSELTAGATLGPYRLHELLGEGGMGVVFRATHESDGEVVALKVLRGELGGDDVYRRRFLHEARAASAVRHPNLVSIREAGDADGRSYLAVAYVPGNTLDERIRAGGPLPVDDVLRLATEIGSALDALHSGGLVHRDVKASNILLGKDGTAMLSDFGLAKGQAYTVLTRPGQVMGTLDYMAPELIRGEPAGPASDIYALGCVVFECAAGQPPFEGGSAFQIGMAHLDETPPDPAAARSDWPPALSAPLLSALEKEPSARPVTAVEYAARLRAARGAAV
jgi:serine/threonine protein kinase